MRKPTRAIFIIWLLLITVATSAQQTTRATDDIIMRTMMIRYQGESATVFTVDIDNREYWITAKHLFTKAKTGPSGVFTEKSVTVEILPEQQQQQETPTGWITIQFNVLDPGKDIDIIILAAPHQPFLNQPGSQRLFNSNPSGPMFGGECEFLGFPYGTSWQTKWEQNPEMHRWAFIKHCTISGRITEPQMIWVLDGINNDGFSGGPVIFSAGFNTPPYVFAVIAGYRPEPLEVVPVVDGKRPAQPEASTVQHPKEQVNANSGFIFAYDFKYVMDAVKQNPFGPLRGASAPSN